MPPGAPARCALVTGAARRLGRAIARDLAEHGWNVAVHHHSSADEAHAAVREIEASGRRAVALRADLAKEVEAAGLIARAARRLGPISLLVNNAAIFEHDLPLTADAASWQRHMAINLRAPLVLTQALVAQLPAAADGEVSEKDTANVVNLIDQRVLNLTPHYTSYTVSKAGLWALTRHLALALAPRVRVNAIGPGIVLAPPGADEQSVDAMRRAMPLRRGAGVEEICACVRFILATPSLTGQMIALDGGQHLGWLHPGQAGPRGDGR
ncbi:MAG TPA: SDR family oxidoreductase [Geminicoccaceae bacterium]|nr:SDR family oxidoreductase [Geminicoccaceae bacterium]